LSPVISTAHAGIVLVPSGGQAPYLIQGAFQFLFCSMCYYAAGSKPQRLCLRRRRW
jgi:hypothetical protein